MTRVFKPFLTLLVASLSLSGCASYWENVIAEQDAQAGRVAALQAEIAKTTPSCAGEVDCRAKWEAAQLWVQKNAGYKIQTVTTVVIETYNPVEGGTGMAFSVTKEPLGENRYRIFARASCYYATSCVETAPGAVLEFNRAVAATHP